MLDLSDIPSGTRTVLDTNTVMALWHFADPRLPRLRQAAESGQLALITDETCLEEFRRVLAYSQFKLEAAAQTALHTAYTGRCAVSPLAPPTVTLPRCRDTDDQKFVELAWRAQARLLVTRDKALLRLGRHRLLRETLAILTPEKLETLLGTSDALRHEPPTQ